MKAISSKLHFTLYFWSLILFAVLIHWSHSMTVIMTVVIGVLWLFQPHFKANLFQLARKPSIILFSTVFLLSIISIPFSKNIAESLHYTKLVLPIMVLPLFIGTSEKLPKQNFALLMYLYILSTVVSSIFNLVYFSFNYSSFADIRLISFFMSHIRYSLFINIAIFACFYYLFIEKINDSWLKLFLLASLIWLIVFLFILQSVTGVVILFFLFFIIIGIKIFKSKQLYLRISLVALLLFVFISVVWNLISIIHEFTNVKSVDTSKMEKVSLYGNPYTYNENVKLVENGNYVFYYICEIELRQTWNSRSKYPYDSLDKKHEVLSQTLVRYLASKNLRKDRDGVLALTKQDVENVENGIPNYKLENRFLINTRIYQIVWEIDAYIRGLNPSGHSVTQRFEFWRCAIDLISDHFFFGVGTGDVQKTLNEYYVKVDTKLTPDKWYFPHNQYFTIMVRFGFVGLILFLLSIFAVVLYEKKQRDFFVFILLSIVLFSMINEDTFETQYGIVLFAFWGSLFIFGRETDKIDDSEIESRDE